MASRKSKRQMKKSHPYINTSATKDSSVPTRMSCEQLEASLTQIGIKVPANLPKIVLRKLLIENMNTISTDVPQIVQNDNADTGTIFAESPSVQTCGCACAREWLTFFDSSKIFLGFSGI